MNQRKRQVIDEVSGWLKTDGGLRKVQHLGTRLVDSITFSCAAYDVVRLRRVLLAHPA